MSDPVPVIICGQRPAVASVVINGIKPEIEVIHLILSTAAGVTEIPRLLEGEPLSVEDPDNLGSKNYSKKPVAVVIGGGFDDESISEMRDACKGKKSVPWFRVDTTIPAPPPGPEYGQALVKRLKARMKELVENGTLSQQGVGHDEFVLF